MKENNNNPLKLEDLDCVLSLSKASKSALKECDEAIPTMERFINQYLETQAIDLEPTERILFKIRAIKEQFSTNIGIAAIPVSIILAAISSALAVISILLNFPSATMTQEMFIIIAATFIIVLVGYLFVRLMRSFMKATKDRILIFKCAYLEHYLAGYIEKQKEQKKKADSADQSCQRKETQK